MRLCKYFGNGCGISEKIVEYRRENIFDQSIQDSETNYCIKGGKGCGDYHKLEIITSGRSC